MDLNTIGGSEEDSCKLILSANFDLLQMYIFHVLRVERFRTLNGTIKKVLAFFELLAIALAQKKSMCHLNLANVMDVQKRYIPYHTCEDSWARAYWDSFVHGELLQALIPSTEVRRTTQAFRPGKAR
ncbi:hypothetical protein J6590_081295 [Homalodisca vitripennis]|nr:hypothetical protein J6590_081295 [Homalodisca vitripennis]